jgi:metallo-beta-lactamase family protein
LESTYGNRLHESSEPIEELVNVIKRSMERGGSLTIPAFSVGRTQTLLFLLRLLEDEDKIPSYPIFVDSPMAIEALQIFEDHIHDFDLFTRMQKMAGKDIFRPQNLHICRSKEESMSINDHKSGCIIISASGMVTGGRIVHHLKQRLPDPKNTVLLIGYQAIGTRGRTIMEKKETVKIHGKEIPINAHIEMIDGFSGHADYNEMLAWLMPFNKPPKTTFLVHGEEDASQAMAEKIKQTYHWNVRIPQFGESFELE